MMMGYNPYGYAPNPYQQPMGGYTYTNSAYNVNAGPAYPSNYPGGMGMGMGMPGMGMGMMMGQAPPSQQTNISINMMFNTNTSFQGAALECLGDEAELTEDEEEEEEEEEEDMGEEEKQERKKIKKKTKKTQKLAKKVAEKCRDDEDFLERVKQAYIRRLKDHLVKDGTLDPTEGNIKPYVTYADDDPVVTLESLQAYELAGTEWDPEMDCQYLKEACDGLGTNEDAIIHIVTTRNNEQRQQLKLQYKTSYGEDLIDVLDGETSGKFRECLLALFVAPAVYDAYCIKKAIQGLGTDESVLIEILMSRTNAQIAEMKEHYGDINPDECATDKDVEQNIIDDTSGDLKRILVSAVQGNRKELKHSKLEEAVIPVMFHDDETDEDLPTGSFTIDMTKLYNPKRVEADAQNLFEAGEDCFGTDEDTFIRIFANRETYELRAIYDEYVKLTQRDVENSIDREFSSDTEKALLTLIQCIKCRPKYFAERLKWTMKGLGTHDSDLIRIICTRSEIDMVQIKEIFLEQNKQTLWNWIDQDCSGDYKKILQAIVAKN